VGVAAAQSLARAHAAGEGYKRNWRRRLLREIQRVTEALSPVSLLRPDQRSQPGHIERRGRQALSLTEALEQAG
jgi:hypothetical protein